MGLSGCYLLMKILLILVNIIFWVFGILVIGLTAWMLTDQMFLSSVSAAQDESSYFTGLFIFLAVGILMFFVAFLGFCGALRESPCMLMTFFCFVLIIVVAEIAAMAWAYNNSAQLEEYIRESVKTTVQDEYGVVPSRTKVFDDIQMGLRCCGANGPRDWEASKYNKGDRGLIDLTVSSTLHVFNVPESCCNPSYPDACNTARSIAGIASKFSDVIYDQGCIDKLMNTLKKYSDYLIGVGISIGVVECLGLIFSIILCCGIRNNDRYSSQEIDSLVTAKLAEFKKDLHRTIETAT